MKKITTLLLALVLSLCAPVCALAATPEESDFLSRYAQEPYVITDCQMQVVVSEYNVLAVTETYQVYFNEARHGIYRYLPLRNQLTRTDGSSATVTARVSHVDTGADECSHEVSGDNYVLRLGSEDETITGPHTYTIRYNYDLGLDTVKNADELYYNLVGTGWDTYIRRVQFSVTMPKDFDPAKLGMSTGSYGTAGTKNVTYTVQDRTISGTVTQVLAPNEGLTLRLILPDGYFKFDYTKYYLTIAMIAALPALAALIVLVLFLKFGRDKRYAPTVEFYPPEGLNSAEVGLWYKGKATNEMVLSLLVCLAQAGCISIVPGEFKRDFVITKRQDYTGQDINLAVFMDGLFPHGRTRTDYYKLKDDFYKTVDTIRADLNSTESRSRIFDRTSMVMKILSFVLLALSAAGGAYFSHLALGDALTLEPSILYAMLAGTLCLALGLIPACCMLRRTDEGAKTLAQIKGFRSFLVTAEKEKLEAMVEQDPEYFYNILPYTYALGVSDKWIKKFESIAMQPPRWYSGVGVWDYAVFNHMLQLTLRAANDSMVSQPMDSGGGSSIGGGGGFTGGGVGGGGGGSW